MNHVFVYGTLMFPELLKALTDKDFKLKDAVLENYSRHQIFDNNIAREYPAILVNHEDSVQGKIICDVDDKSLKILEFYEGDEYQKEILEIKVQNIITKAFVFTWHPLAYCQLKGCWNSDFFKTRHLNDYINIVAPEVLHDYKLLNS